MHIYKKAADFSMDSTYFVMKQEFLKDPKATVSNQAEKEMYSSCSFFKNDLFNRFLLQTI